MQLVVVLPAHNEEDTIGGVIRSIRRDMDQITATTILVVDDGSSDLTVQKANEAGAEYVISHEENLGVGSAVLTGISAALDVGADIICLIDSDDQFSASEIPNVIKPIINLEAEVVVGSRFQKRNGSIPILTIVTNLAMAALMSLILRHRFSDVECGFRALSQRAAANLNLIGGATFAHDMLLDLHSKGFKLTEVPVSVRYFDGRKSRVIESYLKYCGLALTSIIKKLIQLKGN
jgi:glycosyltransferase involved in cell wall biosynthesis